MQRVKYLILGAGPSGLGFAHALNVLGETSFLVLEKEAVAGGLCRSERVDGAPLDIGGGHFLDGARRDVLDVLFRFLPRDEWSAHERISKINIRGLEVDYPIESNLWQLPLRERLDFLESIARAGCVGGRPVPETFRAWILWKLGDRIAEDFMLPYNRKLWSIDLDELGTYWLHKLPDVSFRQSLQSCILRRPLGSLPAHATYYYPGRHGYGEAWKRMGAALGDRLLASTAVTDVDPARRIVNGRFQAEAIVTTIPWTHWLSFPEVPPPVKEMIARLRHVSIDVDYRPTAPATDAHWIYEPDERVAHHRVLCRCNFVDGSAGAWTETNALRSGAAAGWRHRNEYAYPVNTREKPKIVESLLRWARSAGILGIGRWGEWEHVNSDVALSAAMAAARNLLVPDGTAR